MDWVGKGRHRLHGPSRSRICELGKRPGRAWPGRGGAHSGGVFGRAHSGLSALFSDLKLPKKTMYPTHTRAQAHAQRCKDEHLHDVVSTTAKTPLGMRSPMGRAPIWGKTRDGPERASGAPRQAPHSPSTASQQHARVRQSISSMMPRRMKFTSKPDSRHCPPRLRFSPQVALDVAGQMHHRSARSACASPLRLPHTRHAAISHGGEERERRAPNLTLLNISTCRKVFLVVITQPSTGTSSDSSLQPPTAEPPSA